MIFDATHCRYLDDGKRKFSGDHFLGRRVRDFLKNLSLPCMQQLDVHLFNFSQLCISRPANLWIPDCGTPNFGMRDTKTACIAKHSKQNDKMRDIPDFRTFFIIRMRDCPSKCGTFGRSVFQSRHYANLSFFIYTFLGHIFLGVLCHQGLCLWLNVCKQLILSRYGLLPVCEHLWLKIQDNSNPLILYRVTQKRYLHQPLSSRNAFLQTSACITSL